MKIKKTFKKQEKALIMKDNDERFIKFWVVNPKTNKFEEIPENIRLQLLHSMSGQCYGEELSEKPVKTKKGEGLTPRMIHGKDGKINCTF